MHNLSRSFALIGVLFLTLLITSCDQKALIRKMTPDAEDKFAREFIKNVRQGHIAEATIMTDSTIQNAQGLEGLTALSNMCKGGELKSLDVVGVYTFFSAGSNGNRRAVNLTYQIELSTGWFAGTVQVVEKSGTKSITIARFQPISTSLDRLNAFTFSNRGFIHYLFIFLSLAVLLFNLWSLILCARTKIAKRKWLWIVFILFNFVTFKLNWTTGETDFAPLSFLLMGAAILKQGITAPWVLSFALPLGAITFLIRRKELMQTTAEQIPPLPFS